MLQGSNYDNTKSSKKWLQANIIQYKIENKQGIWKQEIVWQKLSKIVTATWGMWASYYKLS